MGNSLRKSFVRGTHSHELCACTIVRFARKCAGGGVLNDMMCHSLEVGRYLLTAPDAARSSIRATKVSAQVASLKWSRPEYSFALLKETMSAELPCWSRRDRTADGVLHERRAGARARLAAGRARRIHAASGTIVTGGKKNIRTPRTTARTRCRRTR